MTLQQQTITTPDDSLAVASRQGWRRRATSAAIAALALAAAGYFAYALATSPNVQWPIVGAFLLNPQILSGVKVTLELTCLACGFGTAIGVVLGVMRVARTMVVRVIAAGYIWFFRGTPLLVQIIFWFNIALFVPRIDLGPIRENTNSLISPFSAAVVALSLNAAAYVCEIVRGGIVSVDRGQSDAALAIGLRPRQAMFRIVLPQAVRVMIPPYGNFAIDLLKATSLVSVIGTQDLLTTSTTIAQKNYHVVELLFVACIWYLILVTAGTLIQQRIERRLARVTGVTRPGRSFRQQLSLHGLFRGPDV